MGVHGDVGMGMGMVLVGERVGVRVGRDLFHIRRV